MRFDSDAAILQHALQIARQGFGNVEPNPQVGAVIVSPDRELIADGFHERFGGPHAEINAIAKASGRTRGTDLFVTLEPCSHFGKTPPCADAVIAAGFRRVVVGCIDPAPHAAGRGLQKLRDAGISVECGLLEASATALIAPFRRQILQQMPWVHAKWAMTLDGRIASRTGHSQWISCEASRTWVHHLRGRVEAIITGAGTVRADDPRLTARPAGPRTPLRVIIDSSGTALNSGCQLVRTRSEAPVLVCVSQQCSATQEESLRNMGLAVLRTTGRHHVDLRQVLSDPVIRNLTHVLVEAGPGLLGAFFDQSLVNEVHAFVAPKIVGGQQACPAIGGLGHDRIPAVSSLSELKQTIIGQDVLIEGIVRMD